MFTACPPDFSRTLMLTLAWLVFSAAVNPPCQAQAPARKFYAVVVGVSEYDSSKLAKLEFASKDASDMESVLRQTGYEVKCLNTDRGRNDARLIPNKRNIEEAVEWLVSKRKRNETILVALSGHGTTIEVPDVTERFPFFCPSDSSLDENIKVDVKTGQHDSMVNINWLMRRLGQSDADDKLIIVDACRNVNRGNRKSGLDSNDVKVVSGVAVIYGCSNGQYSYEFKKEGNGYLTHWLLKAFKYGAVKGNKTISMSSLTDYLNDKMIENSKRDVGDDQFPKLLAGDTKAITLAINVSGMNVSGGSDSGTTDNGGNSPNVIRIPRVLTNQIGMQFNFIPVPPEGFLMGSPEDEAGRKASERQYRVRISKRYYMGATEVTQKEYRRVMGVNPSAFEDNLSNGDRPVEQVSYWDAVSFCKKLSQREGKRYRLPTEAEWEWACRGRSKDAYCFGADEKLLGDYGVYKENSKDNNNTPSTDPVRGKTPNKFGLFDMHGNVAEWVADWAADYPGEESEDPRGPGDGKVKVHRGGSFDNPARLLRSANREAMSPDKSDDSVGFRVLMEVE
jgi:formylglycine-generating enzyme required for sulfatase activity